MEDNKLNKNSQDWEFLENKLQLNKLNTKIDLLENKVIKLGEISNNPKNKIYKKFLFFFVRFLL